MIWIVLYVLGGLVTFTFFLRTEFWRSAVRNDPPLIIGLGFLFFLTSILISWPLGSLAWVIGKIAEKVQG